MNLGQLLDKVYGETGRQEYKKAYSEMVENSLTVKDDFEDPKFVALGHSFACCNLKEVIEGKQKKDRMISIVCRSFGEAGMYKDNICGGKIK